ncbi:Sad1-interacting factor 3 [Malassezia nana]|uniref:Sad1-interacting factor 3 n=1 Tax=Malassezia nana TaxID=180528 RepID=A0AAF0ENE6_9BASI|nr:Sad1-interacting factor 3 [Malassezia nana]
MSASRTGETGPQRRMPLPGISSTASALRTRRAEARGPSYPAEPSDLDDFEVETPGDAALNELPSGIIMPGIKGSRAPQRQPPSKSGVGGGAPPNRPKPLVAPLGALRSGRNAPPKLPAGAGPSRPSLQLKGTPARVPRYSLPVRAEKPVRTSKVSGRHVMLPSESQLAPLPSPEQREAMDESSTARLARRMEQRSDPVYHTFEHMTPQVRVQTRLPRLTSYAISAALHLPTLLAFLRREHDVRPRLYEGCAYVLYFKPLLPGFGRATVRSSKEPQTGSPGASSRHERELQRHEESGYVGDYFVPQEEEDIDTHGYIPNELREGDVDLRHATQGMTSPGLQDADSAGAHDMLHAELEERRLSDTSMPAVHINEASHTHECEENEHAPRAIRDALNMAELIVLPYGVVVMFNFTQDEEESMIKDIMASGSARTPHKTYDRELFQFCYDPHVPAPRINNDFFTFRAPNHLLKLSLAHAIAQSTKLSEFEENMYKTLEMASHMPRELAQTGELHVSRRGALKMSGHLFKLRVDVNLTSDVLDTPDLFWNEASLQALYDAIREYLEMDDRIQTLNERLTIANELLDIIHEHLSNAAMSKITWIIIVLIVVACFVAVGEISARLVTHAHRGSS